MNYLHVIDRRRRPRRHGTGDRERGESGLEPTSLSEYSACAAPNHQRGVICTVSSFCASKATSPANSKVLTSTASVPRTACAGCVQNPRASSRYEPLTFRGRWVSESTVQRESPSVP